MPVTLTPPDTRWTADRLDAWLARVGDHWSVETPVGHLVVRRRLLWGLWVYSIGIAGGMCLGTAADWLTQIGAVPVT